jgi:Na+/proline symporter
MHTFVGPAILIIWGLSYLTTNLGKWILTGLPQMLLQLGLPSYMAEIATGVVAFAVFLLVIEVTTQRDMT